MKKHNIKIKLTAFECLVTGEMLKAVISENIPDNLYLEKLVISELYRRKIALFSIFNGDAKLTLTPAESVALNRLMSNISFDKITGGERVRYKLIEQIEPKLLHQ